MGQIVGRRDVLVLAATEQGRQRTQKASGVTQRSIGIEFEFEEALTQKDDDFRPREHPQVRRQAEFKGVFPYQSVTEGVKGGYRRVGIAVGHELVHSDGHLLCRLVREREGEDLRWPSPSGRDQPRDPSRDDLRLAGARASDDEQRPRTVSHGPQLVRIEATQESLEPRWDGVGDLRVHDRGQLSPGGQLVER